MKKIIIIIAVFSISTFYVFGSWTEEVECIISKHSIESGLVTSSTVSKKMLMDGRHNSEKGSVQLESVLLPFAKINFSKMASGRFTRIDLSTTRQDSLVAKSSITNNNKLKAKNAFLGRNYQYFIECSSE